MVVMAMVVMVVVVVVVERGIKGRNMVSPVYIKKTY